MALIIHLMCEFRSALCSSGVLVRIGGFGTMDDVTSMAQVGKQ